MDLQETFDLCQLVTHPIDPLNKSCCVDELSNIRGIQSRLYTNLYIIIFKYHTKINISVNIIINNYII